MINYEVIAKQRKLMRNAQVLMVCMLSYAMFLNGFENLISLFISYTPKYRFTFFCLNIWTQITDNHFNLTLTAIV